MEEISPSLLGSEVITCHVKFLVNICPNINPVLAQTILHKYRKDILDSVLKLHYPTLPSRNIQGIPNNALLNIGVLMVVKFLKLWTYLKFIEH